MGNITLWSTRKESCLSKGVAIAKITTLHSHDTANPPPSKEIKRITHSNQPEHSASTGSTPTQMALSTGSPKPRVPRPKPRVSRPKPRGPRSQATSPSPLPGAASPALYPDYLTSLPSSLPSSTWRFSRTLATERDGRNRLPILRQGSTRATTYPSLLRSHQTPKGDHPPSSQETCHVTTACENEIKLRIALVEKGSGNSAFWVL